MKYHIGVWWLGDEMKTSDPHIIEIIDGEYARGKIKVTSRSPIIEGMAPVTDALRFLDKIRRPGEKPMVRCLGISTKKGEAIECAASLVEEDRNTHIK